MESWVKIPGRAKASWDRKYLRLEGTSLCTYEHEPSPGMVPINRLELNEKEGVAISESVRQAEVAGTARSDLPFIFRIEAGPSTTCWPSSGLDIMALSQVDKKAWLNALRAVATKNEISKVTANHRYQTVLKLDKHQVSELTNFLLLRCSRIR